MNRLQVVEQNGQLLVDSRDVAEMTGKEHKNLLRDISSYSKILDSSKLSPLNFFIESTYMDKQNKERPCYLLTKKGCDMVANKLTGEKGILFTAAYVTRFDEMEQQLKQISQPSYMIEDPIARAQKWIEEQKQRLEVESKVLMLEQQVAEYEPKINYIDTILESKNTVLASQIAEDYGLSARRLNQILHDKGVQYKVNNQWLLYSKHKGLGYTESKTHTYTRQNGEEGVKMHTRWTQKGRLFIHNILFGLGIEPLMDIENEQKKEA